VGLMRVMQDNVVDDSKDDGSSDVFTDSDVENLDLHSDDETSEFDVSISTPREDSKATV